MRVAKNKDTRPKLTTPGSPMEGPAMMGYSPRQHQDVVPQKGQGPQGTVGVQVPWGDTPAVPDAPVGAGKGFKGW